MTLSAPLVVLPALLVSASMLAGCIKSGPACDDPGTIAALKQLALGKTQKVPNTEAERINAFLAVHNVSDDGQFGARKHCSATLQLSESAKQSLSESADPALSAPIHVEYDVIAALDQSVLTGVVVELRDYSAERATLYARAMQEQQ